MLRIGTSGDYRPFTAFDKASGAYTGFDIDLAHSLADALGVRLEIEPTSWSTLAKDFDADAFDIAMGGVSALVVGSSALTTGSPSGRQSMVANRG